MTGGDSWLCHERPEKATGAWAGPGACLSPRAKPPLARPLPGRVRSKLSCNGLGPRVLCEGPEDSTRGESVLEQGGRRGGVAKPSHQGTGL